MRRIHIPRHQIGTRATLLLLATGCVLALAATSATAQVITTIPVGRAPSGIRFNPINGKVYVATRLDGAVGVISGDEVVGVVPVGVSDRRLAIDTVTNRIYVTNTASDTVSVIDGSTDAVIATIADKQLAVPTGIDVNPITDKIYVANSKGSSVLVIDARSNKVVGKVHVHNGPFGLAVNAATNKVYV